MWVSPHDDVSQILLTSHLQLMRFIHAFCFDQFSIITASWIQVPPSPFRNGISIYARIEFKERKNCLAAQPTVRALCLPSSWVRRATKKTVHPPGVCWKERKTIVHKKTTWKINDAQCTSTDRALAINSRSETFFSFVSDFCCCFGPSQCSASLLWKIKINWRANEWSGGTKNERIPNGERRTLKRAN